MGDELKAIADDLGLPPFRVPAPRLSAQHASAAIYHSQARQPAAAAPAPRQHTRELTREDWQPYTPDNDDEYQSVAGQFAGIDMDDFYWARQRAKRALLFWVVAVLTFTGLVAAAAWTVGSNLGGLIS
jgi:serine/threonine-protein kinase